MLYFKENKLRNQEILLKKKNQVVIKKVHSPNAMISQSNIIVINAFLSLYIELQVIIEEKSVKTLEKLLSRNFS